MPLLSQISMENRSQSQKLRTSVRFCNIRDARHISAGNIMCSYAAPDITALVADDQQHRRVRSGQESSHYSFNAIQNASLLLRCAKRFESIDNDRQESIVDVLNDISNKIKDSHQLLDRVVQRVESEGSVSRLLKEICDAFKESFVSESPQLEALTKNTSFIMDSTEQQVAHTYKLREELRVFCDQYLKSSDKLVAIDEDIKDLLVDVKMESREGLEKQQLELCSVKCEIQMTNAAVEKVDASVQMMAIDMKQELVDIKHQITSMAEEVASLRHAIIDVLPIKLMEALTGDGVNISVQSSRLGSDLEVIDNDEGDNTVDYTIDEVLND